jgi:hypothetical protein
MSMTISARGTTMSTSAPDDQNAADAAGTDASTDAASTAADTSATDDASTADQEGVDPQTLLRELATSIALLPQEPSAQGEEPPEGALALPVIEQDGTQYVPVFTSEEALRAAGADPVTALRLPLAELAASWPDENLWLAVNPATKDGLALPPEVVRALPGFVQMDEGGQAATG